MSENAYLHSYVHSLVRLANKKSGNEPFMREEDLYSFIGVEMPRENEVTEGEQESEPIPDSPESPPEEEKKEEIPEIPESPPGANFTSHLEQARHETFFFQEKSRKIKSQKTFWKKFAYATKKMYLVSAEEHKKKDEKFNVIQAELSDLQYSLSESEMQLARTQRKLKKIEEALEL